MNQCHLSFPGLVCLACVSLSAEEQQVKLGPELVARSGVKHLPAATGSTGPILSVDVPARAWPTGQGTIMMRVRTSRRIGNVPPQTPARKTNIILSPAIGLELSESTDCPRFRIFSPAMAKARGPVIRISYLDPGKWYHLALAWEASTGKVNVYVNGWAQQKVQLRPWKPSPNAAGKLQLGGVLGTGKDSAIIAVRAAEMHAWYMSEAQVRRTLVGQTLCEVGSGVRQSYEHPFDLSGYTLKPIFVPDFSKPLPIVAEDDFFKDGKRIGQPKPGQWVLEGTAKAFTAGGQLTIDNLLTSSPNHVVLWLPRVFPENFLLEFDITIEKEDEGLAIVFFAARPRDDPKGSIFRKGLARRGGLFKSYIVGDVNSYHVSYLAASGGSAMGGPRRTANCRKNSGFWMVACGDDQIQGKGLGRGPHRVKFLKVGSKIRVEANGRLCVAFDDDGKTWGPVLTDGYIGLRQMNHLLSAQYSNLKIYSVELK